MYAYLKNYRQAPRKMRIIADLIKGKSVDQAFMQLKFLVKRGAEPIEKLLKSAVANAKTNSGIDSTNLIVKNVLVDGGLVLRRVERKARGSANVLHKRMSNITMILDTKKEGKGFGVKGKVKKTEVSTKSKKSLITKP